MGGQPEATLAAGAFLNATALNNGGESISINNALGGLLRTFAYDDAPPWPAAADGSGYSLVLIAPATNPDHNLAANWRASVASGGNPGTSDSVTLAGSPAADNDQDGQDALLEHALGSSDSTPGFPDISAVLEADGHITFTYPRNPAADDVIAEAQLSTDLTTWSAAAFAFVSETPQGDGTSLVTVRTVLPAPLPRSYTRLHVRLR